MSNEFDERKAFFTRRTDNHYQREDHRGRRERIASRIYDGEPRLMFANVADEIERGVNVPKFRSFELYRRHTWRPEIITFDELLERARFIVEHVPELNPGEDGQDERAADVAQSGSRKGGST